jgi:hypothetical protein
MADGNRFHPDTSNIRPRSFTYSANPEHEVQFCCPHSISGTAQTEVGGGTVYVCLRCNTGFTSEKEIVDQHRIEERSYHDPIGHRAETYMPDEPLTEAEQSELRRILNMHPRKKRAQAQLVFLRRVKIADDFSDAA